MFLCSNRKVFCSISHLVPLFSVRLGYSQPGFERKDLFQSWSGVLSQPTTGQVLFHVFSVEMISQAWLLCPGRTPVLHAPQAGTVPNGGNAPTPGEFTGWPEREPAVKVMGHWTGLKSSTRKAVLFERFRSKTFKFRGTLTGEGKSAQWGSRAPEWVNRICKWVEPELKKRDEDWEGNRHRTNSGSTQSSNELKCLNQYSCKNNVHSHVPTVLLNGPCCLWYPYEEAVKGPPCQYFSVVISSSVAPALRQ